MTTQHATPAVERANPQRLITVSELRELGRKVMAADKGLYVARRVVNEDYLRTAWDDFRKYQAPRENLPDLDPNPHVTVVYSKRSPFNAVAPDPAHVIIQPQDVVGVEILGPKRAVVLVLRSVALTQRFEVYRSAGVMADHASYTQHITLFYLGANSLQTPTIDFRPAFLIELGGEIQAPLNTDAFGKSMTVYHGSPETDLNVIHALPQEHQFENPTGAFGAFFTPDVKDASRYAGKNGRVYEVSMPVEHPYDMSVKEFGSFADPQQVIDRRAQLIAGGFDGLIVRDGSGSIEQIASFIDVPIEGSEKPKTTAAKPADVLAKSVAAFGAMSRRDFAEQSGAPGEHLYHSTSRDNLDSIASEGLRPRTPAYRGEQAAWPNGGREGRVYLASRPGGALNFAEPDHVLLRVHSAGIRDMKSEFRNTDYYTAHKVSPRHIEVMHGDGSWQPIAGDRMPAPTLEKSLALHQQNVSQATFMGRNLETRHTIYHIHDVRNPDLPDRIGSLHVFHERPLDNDGKKHEGPWQPKGLHLELSDAGQALGAQGINHLAVAVVRAHPEFHDYALSKVRRGRKTA